MTIPVLVGSPFLKDGMASRYRKRTGADTQTRKLESTQSRVSGGCLLDPPDTPWARLIYPTLGLYSPRFPFSPLARKRRRSTNFPCIELTPKSCQPWASNSFSSFLSNCVSQGVGRTRSHPCATHRLKQGRPRCLCPVPRRYKNFITSTCLQPTFKTNSTTYFMGRNTDDTCRTLKTVIFPGLLTTWTW